MMKAVFVSLVCLFAVVSAYPVPYWSGWPYYHHYAAAAPYYWWTPQYYHDVPQNNNYYPRLIYYGEFQGNCESSPDGLYYMDDYSFAYCSNGVKTIQPCAEGSANPAPSYFKAGGYYNFYDFCSINLVAQGYNAHNVPYPAPVKNEAVSHGKSYEVVSHGKGYEETNHYEPAPKATYEEKYYEAKTYEENSKDDGYPAKPY